MKLVSRGLAAALCLAAGVSAAQESTLTVATWGGTYTQKQRQTIIDPFSKESGTKVLDASYTGGLGQLRAMIEAGNATWDVVELEAADVINACNEGLIEPLDKTKLKNAADLGQGVTECGLGAVGWSIVIGYNSESTGDAPKTWADFWDLKKYPGKRAIRRSPQYALEAALLADGVTPAELYKVMATPAGIDRAFKKLDEIKPQIQWWEAGSQPAEWLASGNVVMSTSYVGRLLEAAVEKAPVKFGWNGAFYSLDYWAIIKGTKRLEASYDFLNFATDAKPQAAFSEIQPVAPVNVKAEALLTPERRKIMPIGENLAQGAVFDDQFWVDNADALTERFNNWLSQ
ncbi:ABC transporter substrate-binding protein (plasmid) [Agrobacterium leguminum]|uniref:ABC transporter substrate-binding protein n=1 Tax=Agrobacterium leguminum TaxID=2792015 RepID=UPI00272975E5|nr:ABC transporter substrate-binding protein [Agrobacterium leguminum]WLE00694.1 ABC transporter substrate-binding protein [Agrobacterium leguminum]